MQHEFDLTQAYIIVASVIVGLIFLLKIWNIIVRNYNNNILSNSRCYKCGSVLGMKCLDEAIQRWEYEKQKIREESQKPTIIISDMDLICPRCGKRNSEQDLYRRNRERSTK
jgi:hypothetical protein